jgi:anti-sigma factor RsiW
MPCELEHGKLDAYVDGELAPAEATAIGRHLRNCSDCAADALERMQMKRAVSSAGKRYEPSAKVRVKITRIVAAKRRRSGWAWQIVAAPAILVVILSVAVNWYVGRESARQQRIYSELADLHVAALASSTPVDVISSDRHTVKPWFQGKIPFTFNLPELQGSDFTLLGGRVTYLAQTPGAQLIYQIRKHEISVFIFQDRVETSGLPSGKQGRALSFNTESWTQNGSRYFVISDVGANDIARLSQLLKDAE